ncbi:kinase-like domain-containing protein [Nemania sp. FL0031]|nr:kinase-like domain-containing protein [Nemania sp. FL0031]
MPSSPSDFTEEWIWGDDAETTVFAQGYGNDRTVIFSFRLDSSQIPTSLPNRICNSFHALEVPEAESFPNPDEMRDSLWSAVRGVWPVCLQHESISRMDTIVDVGDEDRTTGRAAWKVYSHPWFPRFLQILADTDLGRTTMNGSPYNVPFECLVRYEQLGGHGCATRVRLNSDAKDFYVFKGIDFRTFLAQSDDEGNPAIKHTVRGWHNSNMLLNIMPAHPNILPAPLFLVTVDQGAEKLVCGTIQPLYVGGDVRSSIEASNYKGQRLPLELKAHWCQNMAAALLHTHRVAKSYHMDIKPGNFLIDEHQNLVLCDWEQTDAPSTTLAPEADGTWDVMEDDVMGTGDGVTEKGDCKRRRLRYTKYDGPPRRNVPEDALGDAAWHAWNVFPLWNKTQPFALELAEVFSLGRAMWMLLRQPEMEFDHVDHPNDLHTDWASSEDLPELWKEFVNQCMDMDPNRRPDMLEVYQFWDTEWNTLKEARVPA